MRTNNKRLFAPLLCAAATAYTIWYMHYGVPYENSGALSKIGLAHRGAFVVWGVLTFTALAVSIISAYRRYTKNKIYIPLLFISAVGMALTLIFRFDFNIKPDYYFHCVGSLIFSVVTGITVFVLFALCYKQHILFKVFTYTTGTVLIIDLICLLIFKETGLIEALPIFAGYAMLSVVNLRRDKIELKR